MGKPDAHGARSFGKPKLAGGRVGGLAIRMGAAGWRPQSWVKWSTPTVHAKANQPRSESRLTGDGVKGFLGWHLGKLDLDQMMFAQHEDGRPYRALVLAHVAVGD